MITAYKTPQVESKPALDTIESGSPQADERKQADLPGRDEADETLYLIGRPKLKQYLRFVGSHAVHPPSEGSLVDEWQAAAGFIGALEKEEAGAADNPQIDKILPDDEPLLAEFLKDPLVRGSFNALPTEVAMVELDRMVVYQKHIDLTFVEQLEAKLGPAPDKELVFRTCLPYDHPQPPVKWSRGHDSFVFVSPSNDLRFLGTMRIQPGHVNDYPPPGDLVGVVGLAVGFGSNFLNAVYAENRLILNNGSHRAYTLRKLGFTHVPCIVQHASTRDAVDLEASSEVRSNPDLYLKHPRPPMLRDYFHPKLHKVMPVHRRLRQVTVKFEVDENDIPVL